MTYPKPPRPSKILSDQFWGACKIYLDWLTWEQLLEFTQDLVKEWGKLEVNGDGVEIPDCPNSVFPHIILKNALARRGHQNKFATTYANTTNYGLISADLLYAGYIVHRQEQPIPWYWELIHDDKIVAAGFEQTKDWAWASCVFAYSIRTQEPPSDEGWGDDLGEQAF